MRQPMRRAVVPAALLATMATALGLGVGVATAADPAVTITDAAYDPVSITIQVGQTVFWTNAGQQSHTVTADDGSFDSGQLDRADAFANLFEVAGIFSYHSTMAGDAMTGTVIVEPAPPTPVPSGSLPPPTPTLPTGISPTPLPTVESSASGAGIGSGGPGVVTPDGEENGSFTQTLVVVLLGGAVVTAAIAWRMRRQKPG